MIESCLYLVVGKDAAEVRAWMQGYAEHWMGRQLVYEPERLLLVDATESIAYHGIDGSEHGWRRQIQHARPETVILLAGWTDVQGIGMELDLLRAVGARVVFAEPFGVIR
jgi:hypothetical protein